MKSKDNLFVALFFILVPVLAIVGGLWLTNLGQNRDTDEDKEPLSYEEIYDKGFSNGRDEGYLEGYHDAELDFQDDYQEGFDAGYDYGYEDGMNGEDPDPAKWY